MYKFETEKLIGSEEDIRPYVDSNFSKNIILSATEFLTMKRKTKDGKYALNKNTIVFGKLGTGKTRNLIMPNLMQMHSSYVVLDRGGEILDKLGSMFRGNGYDLKVLDLLNFDLSNNYNPFEYIKNHNDIFSLVDALVANVLFPKNESPNCFSTKVNKMLLRSLFAGVRFGLSKEKRKMETIINLINSASEGFKEDDVKKYEDYLDNWFKKLNKKKDKTNNVETEKGLTYAISQYEAFKVATERSIKMKKAFLITCEAMLCYFGFSEIKKITNGDNLKLRSLGTKKSILFIVTPEVSNMNDSLLTAMLLTQTFNVLLDLSDKNDGHLPVHVRFLLDDFGSVIKMPKLKILPHKLKNRNISIMMTFLSESQFKSIYLEDFVVIMENFDSIVFLDNTKPFFLKFPTKVKDNESQEMELLDVSVNAKKCTVYISGLPPFVSDKYKIEDHPNYKFLNNL